MTTFHRYWRLAPRLWPALLLLAVGGGCAHFDWYGFNATALHYVPPTSVCKPRRPLPYCADPAFFGYHGTCWEPWPEGWEECPSHDVLFFDENGEPLDLAPPESLPPAEQPQPPAEQPQPPTQESTPPEVPPSPETPPPPPEPPSPDDGAHGSRRTPTPATRTSGLPASGSKAHASASIPAPFQDTASYTRGNATSSLRRTQTRSSNDTQARASTDAEPRLARGNEARPMPGAEARRSNDTLTRPLSGVASRPSTLNQAAASTDGARRKAPELDDAPLPFDLEFGHSHSAVYLKEADAGGARVHKPADGQMEAGNDNADGSAASSLPAESSSLEIPRRTVPSKVGPAPVAPAPSPDPLPVRRVLRDDGYDPSA